MLHIIFRQYHISTALVLCPFSLHPHGTGNLSPRLSNHCLQQCLRWYVDHSSMSYSPTVRKPEFQSSSLDRPRTTVTCNLQAPELPNAILFLGDGKPTTSHWRWFPFLLVGFTTCCLILLFFFSFFLLLSDSHEC